MQRDPSPYAGKTVQLRTDTAELGGHAIDVVDWYENTGKKVPWRDAVDHDPRAQGYYIRHGLAGLPDDNDVLFGRVDGMGQLVHHTEIDGEQSSPPTNTVFGPKPVDKGEVGTPCLACQRIFIDGDMVSVHVLGPGLNPAARRKAKEGKAFNAVVVELHWACATGDEQYETTPPPDPTPIGPPKPKGN